MRNASPSRQEVTQEISAAEARIQADIASMKHTLELAVERMDARAQRAEAMALRAEESAKRAEESAKRAEESAKRAEEGIKEAAARDQEAARRMEAEFQRFKVHLAAIVERVEARHLQGMHQAAMMKYHVWASSVAVVLSVWGLGAAFYLGSSHISESTANLVIAGMQAGVRMAQPAPSVPAPAASTRTK
jgi:hypothetical protein